MFASQMSIMLKSWFLLILFSPIVYGQGTIYSTIENFKTYSEFKNAGISISVVDLVENKLIASLNPDLALPPASTVKLISTSTALSILGPQFKAQTRFYTNGKVTKGILVGDLIIRGGGDPSLGSRFFNEEGKEADFILTWLEKIKEIGISKITGKIIVDGSEFGYHGVPDGWSWGDMGNYYGSGPSGIVVYDNMLKYYFKTAESGSDALLIKTFPTVSNFQFSNSIKSQGKSGDNSYIFGTPFSNYRFGEGYLPVNQASFMVKGSLPDPEFQLASDFHDSLKIHGVVIDGGFSTVRNMRLNQEQMDLNYQKLTQIYTYEGAKLIDIITQTNMKSINLFAEQCIALIGHQKNGDGSTENGLRVLNDFWKSQPGLSGMAVKDGSGLSRTNAISSQMFCSILNKMYTSEHAFDFKNTLPIAGQSGTLSSVCKNQAADGRVFAKSGTMNRIKSYAGYVDTKSGKKLAFAVILTNFNCSNQMALSKIEELFNAMASY